MKYVTSKNIDLVQMTELYNSVGWTAYTKNPAALQQAMSNSLLVIAAIDKDKVIGLIRVVGDGISIIYIQDLLIAPQYQRQGVGSHLIELVLNQYQSVRQKVLLTIDEPQTRLFYEKCGFVSCDRGELVAFYREF